MSRNHSCCSLLELTTYHAVELRGAVVLRCEDGSSWRCTLSDGLRNRRAMGRVRLYRYRHSISSRLDHSDVHCCCRRCCNLEHRSSRSLRSIAALIDMAHKQQTNNKQRTNKAGIKPLYLIGMPTQGGSHTALALTITTARRLSLRLLLAYPDFRAQSSAR